MLKHNEMLRREDLTNLIQKRKFLKLPLKNVAKYSSNKPKTRHIITNPKNNQPNVNPGRATTLSTISLKTPQRGDVWLVGFDPTLGSEIVRPDPQWLLARQSLSSNPVRNSVISRRSH